MAHREKGFSLIELLIVVAIILIIAAIAIPNMMRARVRANEAAAVQALRTLNTSQAAYNATYGALQGYAGSLGVLGPAATCDVTHACLIDNLLGCAAEPCARGGFKFFSTSDSSSTPFTDYSFTATPNQWGSSGSRNFCTSEDGMIRYQLAASASLGAAVTHSGCVNFALYNGIQN